MHNRQSYGFTLLEVIVALSILGTTILSVFAIYSHVLVQVRRSQNRTFATQAAQMMMEKIVSSSAAPSAYHNLGTDNISEDTNAANDDLRAWKRLLDTFPTEASGRIAVADDALITDDDGTPLCSKVRVSVTYDDHGRHTTTSLLLSLEKR